MNQHTDRTDDEDVLVTPGEAAAWAVVLSLLAFLAVVFASIAAVFLIAAIY